MNIEQIKKSELCIVTGKKNPVWVLPFINARTMLFSNVVTNGMAEVVANGYKITHMYGQWGEEEDYPEGYGPFFTPDKTDVVEDLSGEDFFTTDAEVAISYEYVSTEKDQSLYSSNVKNFVGLFPSNPGKIYIGVGLVAEVSPSKKILVARTALDGIKKSTSSAIAIGWSIVFN